jgi:acyl carrier protein
MDGSINFTPNIDRVFRQLKQFIAEIIGEDVVEELNVTRKSTFVKDLEMDSIEIVAFAEKVKAYYGHQVNFIGWLSKMKIKEIINLSIGDVADFIANALYSRKEQKYVYY